MTHCDFTAEQAPDDFGGFEDLFKGVVRWLDLLRLLAWLIRLLKRMCGQPKKQPYYPLPPRSETYDGGLPFASDAGIW